MITWLKSPKPIIHIVFIIIKVRLVSASQLGWAQGSKLHQLPGRSEQMDGSLHPSLPPALPSFLLPSLSSFLPVELGKEWFTICQTLGQVFGNPVGTEVL